VKSGVVIETFVGTITRPHPGPERAADSVKTYNSHRMHLLEMKFVVAAALSGLSMA
jgi:hypothetical protein